MTTPPESAATRPIWLGIWPVYLLLLEYLAVSVSYDARPLLRAAGSAHHLGYLGILAPGLIVVATLVFVLSGPGLRSELAQLLRTSELFGQRQKTALAVNLACFAGLWQLTALLLEQASSEQEPSAGALLGFLALAAGCALSLLLAAVPPPAFTRLGPRALRVLALGACVGALAWGAGVASAQLWQHMQRATLYLVFGLMLPFSDAIAFAPDDALIGTESFWVEVAPECSGIEGIGLISVVMGVYLWSARQRLRFPRALWLLPVSVALVFLGNALRIALLIAVGVNVSADVALSGFHSKAGWLFFCGIALALIAWAQRSAWLRRTERAQLSAATEATEGWNATATYLMPLLALISAALLTSLFAGSSGFDRWYGLRVLAVALALYSQRKHLPAPHWPPSLHAPAIGLAVFGLWLWLAPRGNAQHAKALQDSIGALGSPWSAVWLALRVLGTVVAVPIAEELAFRGFLLRRLVSADFTEVPKTQLTLLALCVSSAAFAALHPDAMAAACLAGVAYALAQQWRGRMADAIIAHAVTNACIAAYVLATDAYGLWL